MSLPSPAANPVAQPNVKRKTWREIHRERKVLRKQHRQENEIRKIEKQKKREELSRQKTENEEKTPLAVSTLSIAVPGSILDNAQSAELRTYLAGQIARAACVFKVDEVIVYDDVGTSNGPMDAKRAKINEDDDDQNADEVRYCCMQLARILQYLECPQYLRKFFFPIHRDLKFSGLLNPLDAPHHLRQQSEFIFREGVVSAKPPKQTKGSYVNIGLLNDCLVDKILMPGLRVTVKLAPDQDLRSRKIKGTIVSPSLPRAETGVYWGYQVRVAKSLSDIFTKSPYADGYDLTIGTSDRGENVHGIERESLKFNHALVVYGGLQGLEAALENDEKLDVDDPCLLFDQYLNVVPGQGSRTIRTEEAILISLAALKDKLSAVQPPIEFDLSSAIPQSEDTGVAQYAFNEPAKRKLKRKPNASFEDGNEENDGDESHANTANDTANCEEFSRFD